MHDLAVISRVQKIESIEGKDRIVKATIQNYSCIVQKDEYKEGDLCIYVFYDSILPNEEQYEFLRKRCWSDKYQGFRIKPMKMGGIISEGLALPLSSLPEGKSYKEGDVVTEDLRIRRYNAENENTYVPPKRNIIQRFFYRIKTLFSPTFSTAYPSWIKKSDEDNIEALYSRIDKEKEYILTEKIEGMAGVWALEKKQFMVFSHNWRVEKGAWVDWSDKNKIKKKLKAYCKDNKIDGIAISGELIGPGIQRNIYNKKDLEMFIYGGYHLDGTPLTYSEMQNIASYLSLPLVPYLGVSKPYDIENMLKDSEGTSLLYDVPREGIVWRTADGKSHFKVKSRSYKVWFG